VLCSDGALLSTKDVYSRVDLSLTSGNRPSYIYPFLAGRASLSELLYNDLEAAAAVLHPDVLVIKSRLREAGALEACMTGSGSAVFGVCADWTSAERIARRMREIGYWAEAVRTCDDTREPVDGR
jgi:4-diphosphocytidyl-2-C-methyl-D-erythritol kinase